MIDRTDKLCSELLNMANPTGFPCRETCTHGAGPGAICPECAGPINQPLRLALGLKQLVSQMLESATPEELEKAVYARNYILNWATDRENCFRSVGRCACNRCEGDK